MKVINAVDLFCGAGGTSTGLAIACRELNAKPELLAINHWSVAVETHKANHPWAKHLCEAVERVNPLVAVPSGRLNLLVASPECTNHSIARGGRPINDQSRATAWHVLKWAQELYIENILIENVREFRDWGPIGADRRPLRSKKGETYRAFLTALRSLGYRVEERILNAADYGDATTRERLFILARRPAHKRITWPEPTHSHDVSRPDLFGGLRAWRPAKEIIDWSIESQSIFTRRRPLAPTTLDRIAAGLRKFCGAAAEPFLVMLYGTSKTHSIKRPLPTVTANGQHIGLCQPFILQQQSAGAPRSTDKPLPTIAGKGAQALVTPFLIPFYGERPGQNARNHSVEAPLPTQTTSNKFGLVEPFILPPLGIGRGNAARDINKPVQTILASRGGGHLVEPYIVPLNHGNGDKRSYSTERPMPSITTVDAWALIQPMLLRYNGTGRAHAVTKPVPTITAKDRFGLVEPGVTEFGVDIRFRMLRPHELAAAMGFPSDYKFSGNREAQVKQIGNAVAVNTARALCHALLSGESA